MRLEFMQEKCNQLQQSRWEFFYFYHLSCWEPLLPSQIWFPNLSSVTQSVSVTLHHSETGRHHGSESLTKERGEKFTQAPSSTEPEA